MKARIIILLTGAACFSAGILCGRYFPRQPAAGERLFGSGVESPTSVYGRHIFLPVVSFDNATISEIVDYLRSQTRTGIELKEASEPPAKLNFIIHDPGQIARPVTLELRNARLKDVCDRVAQLSGLRISYDHDAIVFSAAE